MPFTISKKAAEKHVKESFELMYNLPALKQFSKHPSSDTLVLDLGCGGGQDSLYLAKQNFKVMAIDISSEMIKIAKRKVKHQNVKFKKCSFETFSTNDKFSGIWCAKVFHFIPIKKQTAFIKKAASCLESGGVLYITSKTTEKRKDYELPDGYCNTIRKRLTRKTFESIVRKNGFKIIKFKYWKNKVGMEILAKKN